MSQVMHPDRVDMSCLSGFVPSVEDGLKGLTRGGAGKEVRALFGHLVVGLLHLDGGSDGLDGHVVQGDVTGFTGFGKRHHPVASAKIKVLDLSIQGFTPSAAGEDQELHDVG